MSGGVDSCVAAALLVEQGYDVVGVTMRLWTVDRPDAVGHQHCCSAEDAEEAAEVASLLGISHYILNFEHEFASRVVEPFVQGYAAGITPNPCQACNEHIKFRSLMQRAASLDADIFATGHYARLREQDGLYELSRAADTAKDQSYFLYTLSQTELARLLFPLGDLQKTEVRAIARRMGLPVADKPDSEEICFVPDNDYRRFVRDRVESPPGEFVAPDGTVLGRHEGIVDFTVGQRRGLGAFGERRYVIALEPVSNKVVVGSKTDLFCNGLMAANPHWVSGNAPTAGARVLVKYRYKAPLVAATIYSGAEGVELRFDEPQRAVSPGQAAVCYQDDALLGGATIVRTYAEEAAVTQP